MNKIIVVLTTIALFIFAGCSSPADSKTIALSLSGTGHYAIGDTVVLKATPTYSGTGTLSYDWTLGGQLITWNHTDTESTTLSVTGSGSMSVRVTVTDGSLKGSASGQVSW